MLSQPFRWTETTGASSLAFTLSDLKKAKWPDGVVLWCLVEEWPAHVELPSYYMATENPRYPYAWSIIHKDVYDMVQDAMWTWNPLKHAKIWHKSCGTCPCKEKWALRIKIDSLFAATAGFTADPTADRELSFKPLPDEDPTKEQHWRHEWGHVLGFLHEHQRADLWQAEHPPFELVLHDFQDYGNYFYCEDGQVRGRRIPPDIVATLNEDSDGEYPHIEEGSRYSFDLMSSCETYAIAAGASWQGHLPEAPDPDLPVDVGDGHGGHGVDPDAIMLYSSSPSVWWDPNLGEDGAYRMPFRWATPRYNPRTGKMSKEILINFEPSAAEKARLVAMYPQ